MSIENDGFFCNIGLVAIFLPGHTCPGRRAGGIAHRRNLEFDVLDARRQAQPVDQAVSLKIQSGDPMVSIKTGGNILPSILRTNLADRALRAPSGARMLGR